MGMDRRIERSRRPLLIKLALVAVFGSGVAFAGYRVLKDSSVATFRVAQERVTIDEVRAGYFEDFIPVRGTVTPLRTVFLDAVEGGRVEKVFVEAGAIVEQGQPLLQFSNSDLQLSVATTDTSITEQLNNLNNTRNQLETTKLQTEKELIEAEYRMTNLQRRLPRMEQLVAERLVSDEEYQAARDEAVYLEQLIANIRARQMLEDRIRQDRLKQIDAQIVQLEANLQLSKDSFENLLLRASASGQLSSFDAEIGQSKTRGQRLGQIDDVEEFKLEVLIDEFYVTRTQPGQRGEFTLQGKPYELVISKVYPEIANGTFKVDMDFAGAVPADIRRGQTLQVRVQLGDSADALLLSRGGFFQDTGGNWAFVLDEGGEFAEKRNIRLGRRNPEYFEVLEGLSVGERVITSEYAAFTEMDRIAFE
ncbi:MAG TPA: HlyD family efflux transporter periplasmic adaptor subunit [Pseudomonadales bacterium]